MTSGEFRQVRLLLAEIEQETMEGGRHDLVARLFLRIGEIFSQSTSGAFCSLGTPARVSAAAAERFYGVGL